MQVNSVTKVLSDKNNTFFRQSTDRGRRSDAKNNEYNAKEKILIAGMSAVGVVASLAVLSKCKGSSLGNYFKNAKFEELQIISMGAGSCLGGLAGGYAVDKNPENRRLKKRESVMQIGNISIPILTVGACSRLGKKLGKVPQAIGAIAGLFAGVFLANISMNRLSDAIFHTNNKRKVKLSDFSVHIDDMLVAASFVSDAPVIQKLARIIPFALVVPGYETGKQKAK